MFNQVPQLTQDTNWESDKLTIRHLKLETSGQAFPIFINHDKDKDIWDFTLW